MTIADFYLLLEIKDKTGDDLFVDPWTLGNLRNDMDDIPLLRTLFICQMAIWSVTCFFHIFVAERQSDYLVMLGHHLATIGAIGQAGVPGPTFLVVAVLLSAGIPIEGLPLLFALDRIFDMIRTALNITGDAACAVIIDEINDKKDILKPIEV